jgi:hypothetical protein
MKIGNWEVTGSAIEWKGSGRNQFVINKKNLAEKIESDDVNLSLYKWIVLATEEEWLTEDDLYDLNFAFVYAAGESKTEFDYQAFDETLSYQYSQLEDDDDDAEEDDDGEDEEDDDSPKGGSMADLEQQRKMAESERD